MIKMDMNICVINGDIASSYKPATPVNKLDAICIKKRGREVCPANQYIIIIFLIHTV